MIYDRSTELLRGLYDRRLATPAVLDTATHFPAARQFADHWEALRVESLRIARDIKKVPLFHELMEEQADISAQDDRDWRMFVLKAYGIPATANMNRCPTLATLVANSPEVLSAAFSFLAPHKHIPQHRGPFRGVLRFYLGLSVPAAEDGTPSTHLTIDGIEHRIGNGEYLLWDDTFPHEVRNNSDELRIALLLDIRRRGLPLHLALLSNLIIKLIGTTIRVRGII